MFKKGHCRPLFYLFFVFSIQLTVNIVQYHFADDWIRTADLFRRKQPLYQLSHNHCPRERKCFLPVPANQRQRQDVSIWKLVHELLIQSSAAKNFFSLNKSFNAAHLREREREREAKYFLFRNNFCTRNRRRPAQFDQSNRQTFEKCENSFRMTGARSRIRNDDQLF